MNKPKLSEKNWKKLRTIELKLCVGAVVVMIVWQLNPQLHMQSVPITTDVMSSNLDQGEVYNMIHLLFGLFHLYFIILLIRK